MIIWCMLYCIVTSLKDFRISLLFLALLLIPLTLSENMAIGQQELQQLHQQAQITNSPVNSICQLIQDNSLIVGLAGLDQAVNICNNLSTMNPDQALSELCSIVGGFNIINVESFCNQQNSTQDQQQQQSQTSNNTNQIPNANQGSGNQGNNPLQSQQEPSGSIIDRLLNMLYGFLNFGN